MTRPSDSDASVDGLARSRLEAHGEQVVSFSLRGQRCGVSIARVRETVEMTRRPVTRMVGTPDFVLGIFSLRGSILAALDLGRFLGMPRTVMSSASRVLVVEGELVAKSAGLLVDAVEGHRRVDPATVVEAPPAVVRHHAAAVRGLSHQEDGPMVLLDVDAILDARELKPFERPT